MNVSSEKTANCADLDGYDFGVVINVSVCLSFVICAVTVAMTDAVHLLASVEIMDGKRSSGMTASEETPTSKGTSTTKMPADFDAERRSEMSDVTVHQQTAVSHQHQPQPAPRRARSRPLSKSRALRHSSQSLALNEDEDAAKTVRPRRERPSSDRDRLSGRHQSDLIVQAKQSAAVRKQPNGSKRYFLRLRKLPARLLAFLLFLLSPIVRLGVYAGHHVRAGLARILDYFFGSIYRSIIMTVCVATRRSDVDGVCGHGMPRRLQLERLPARPPSPDLSHLTDEERQLLATTFGRLKVENENELLRIKYVVIIINTLYSHAVTLGVIS